MFRGGRIPLTLIEQHALTSIKVNNVFIPANALKERVHKFAEPALFHTEGMNEYHLSKSGTATKLRVGNRFFALLCNHQMTLSGEEFGYDQFCLFGKKRQRLVSSERSVFVYDSVEKREDFDAILFEFTNSVQKQLVPKHDWFCVKPEQETQRLPSPLLVVGSGFPGETSSFLWPEGKRAEFNYTPFNIWGKQSKPDISGRLAFTPEHDLEIEPSGMSGGPVFGITQNGNEFELFWAGIITEASKKKIHFLSATRLKRFFNLSLEN